MLARIWMFAEVDQLLDRDGGDLEVSLSVSFAHSCGHQWLQPSLGLPGSKWLHQSSINVASSTPQNSREATSDDGISRVLCFVANRTCIFEERRAAAFEGTEKLHPQSLGALPE